MLIKSLRKVTLNKIDYIRRPYWQVVLSLLLGCFLQIAHAEYLIGPEDALSIKVYGYEDLTTETRVSDQGLIVFPLVGEVKVGGQSTLEASRNITQQLSKGGYIKNAHVTVVVLDYKSQQVSVLGQVNKPGQYTLEIPRTLADVIAMAGGISPLGEDRVIITRSTQGKNLKIEVDLRKALESPDSTKTIAIEKGDVLYIPKAPLFYIHGEVQRPGSFKLEPNMTVSQAISVGGGLTPKGTLRDLVIERRELNGKTKTIDVELTDLILKDDVVVVDERLF